MHDMKPTTPSRSRRRWRRWLLLLLGVLALGVGSLALTVDRYGQVDRAQPAAAIVVLGAGVRPDGTPGDSLHARVMKAVTLYRRGLAPVLVFTGGVGDYPPAEAVAAARLARAQGVPDEAMVLETRSTSTRENLANAALLCRAHGWQRVIVVSDPYHLWRAHYFCVREHLAAFPSPATGCLRNRNLALRAVWTVREALLLCREWLIDSIP